MRLRVLYVEGMPRPMVVVDRLGAMDRDTAQTLADGLRAGLADYDVILCPTAELPQLGEVDEQ